MPNTENYIIFIIPKTKLALVTEICNSHNPELPLRDSPLVCVSARTVPVGTVDLGVGLGLGLKPKYETGNCKNTCWGVGQKKKKGTYVDAPMPAVIVQGALSSPLLGLTLIISFIYMSIHPLNS